VAPADSALFLDKSKGCGLSEAPLPAPSPHPSWGGPRLRERAHAELKRRMPRARDQGFASWIAEKKAPGPG
jgi:hypothetical protein